MIKRIITDEIKAEAMVFAKEITEASVNCTHKFGNDGINQHYIGRIGELIFKGWLVEHYIKGDNPNEADGSSDEYDFKLKGSDKTIDVKTAKSKLDNDITVMVQYYKTYISTTQITKVIDYYVHIVLDNNLDCAYIIGYINRDSIINNYIPIESKRYPNNYNHEIPICNLGDIRELILNLTGKLIDGYVKPPKQYSFMDVDLSTLPKNPGKVKNLDLIDYTSDYMLSLPMKPKVKQSLMDY